MPHIFISYAKKDTRPLAEALDAALNATTHITGLTSWMDRSLRAGQNWRNTIQTEINKCDLFLVLLSQDVNRPETHEQLASYVHNELNHARSKKKAILPVLVHDIDMPMDINHLHFTDLRSSPNHHQLIIDDIYIHFGIEKPVVIDAIPQKTIKTQTATGLLRKRPRNLQEAVEYAWNFNGKTNKEWMEVTAPLSVVRKGFTGFDIAFCLVPAGSFMMGSDYQDDEKLIHQQTFPEPFWISKYPVTNAQWKIAMQTGVVNYMGDSEKKGNEWFASPRMSDAPVVSVNWYHAKKFAEWLGCRLPTEREWEYSARGVESWIYPWGNIFDEDRLVCKLNSQNAPHRVSNIAEGRSWVGAYHLSGNVWEWTESLKQNYPYIPDGSREITLQDSQRVIRGGSWARPAIESRASARGVANVYWNYPDYGFRLILPIS